MGSWQNVAALTLFGGLFALACSVTSGSDDDDAGVGGSGTGGANAGGDTATGGTATGGVNAGGDTATGGTGTGTGGATYDNCGTVIGATDDCSVALRASCCTEFNACTDDCATEFGDAQTCFIAKLDADNFIDGDGVQTCVDENVVGTLITPAMVDLMLCLHDHPAASIPCTGWDTTGEIGTAGAGG